MSETKLYKYTLRRDDSVKEIRRVYTDSSRRLIEVVRNDRIGIFKPTLNVRSKTCNVAEDKKTCSEYGEFIAHKMLEKMGIPSCDVEMIKRYMINPRSKSGKGNEIPGAISYIDLEQGETLFPAIGVVSWFKYEHTDEFTKIANPLDTDVKNGYMVGLDSEIQSNNIEVIIPAFMAYAKELGGLQIKKQTK